MNRYWGSTILGLLVSISAAAGETENAAPKGKILFEKHGCTNCHGQDGVNPTSKYVPVLKGKSAAYLLEQATAIFGNDRAQRKIHAMHDQFCIGQKPEEGCYPVPTHGELAAITDWLGSAPLPAKKRTPLNLYVSSTEAYDKLKALGDAALFVDVRTRAEVAFLGMPKRADANIPYMTLGAFDEWDAKKRNFKLQPNSDFVLRMDELVKRHGLNKDSPVFLICRSGSRSAKAAKLLNLAGYSKVYTVTDGYEGDKARSGPRKGERVVNGWKNSGLPWSYKLDKEAMYWEL